MRRGTLAGVVLMAALLAGCATVPALQPRTGLPSYAAELRRAAEMPGPRGEKGLPQLDGQRAQAAGRD